MNEHQTGINETAYTHSRRPVQLIFVRSFNDYLQAIAFEKQLKKWTRKKKEALAMNDIQLLKELAACKNETSHKLYIQNSNHIIH